MSLTSWFHRMRSRGRLAAGLFGRAPQDAELDEELEFHIAKATERNVRRGMPRDEARRAALAAFGGRAYWADETRDQQRSRLLDDFGRDLQYGAATLRRNPGFAISAVLTIALAIAATTAVFSFINAVYLRPLDVPEGTRLVRIYGADHPEFDLQLGWPAYETLRSRTHAFDLVAAHYSTAPLYVTSRNQSAEVMGAVVSASYFPMLGVRPALGRFFNADEDAVPDRDAVAVIGHGLWQSRFGGDPGVLGEHIVVNGREFTVIGVAPPSFEGVVPSWLNELWIPTMMLHTGYRWCDGFERTCAITSIIARLAPGVTLGAARSELSALRGGILENTDPSDSIKIIGADAATGLTAWQQRDYGHLSTLLSAIALVLLIVACANLGGLLLARGIAREKEIALRCSLGASRWRVARQLLTESLIIGIVASLAGVVLSRWTSQALVGVLAADNEGYVRRLAVPLDWRVVGFAVMTTVVAVFLFGLLPALRVSRADPAESLKSGPGGSLAKSRVRSTLVAGQMMLTLALLVAAGLLTRSFARVMATGNLDSAHLSQLRLRPRLVGYTPERAQAYLVRALDAIRRVPGVVDAVPIRGSMVNQSTDRAVVALPGEAASVTRNRPEVDYLDVGPRYFATLHVPVLVGREFSDRDTPSAPLVAMVNEALALRLWSTINVVGRRIILDGKSFEVVGVVRNYRVHRSDESPPAGAYVAYWQSSFEPQIDARVLMRVQGDPAPMFTPIRRALEAVDVGVPVTETITMDAQRSASYKEVRLGGAMLLVSASLALFLSAIGLYGVVSFVVARRAKEVSIRLAVGARPAEVVALFVRQGLRPMWLGAALGVAASVSLAPLLSRWLFGIAPLDMSTFVGAVIAVTVVAFVATWVPARRAARTDPAVVFRTE
jgi:predicted permease